MTALVSTTYGLANSLAELFAPVDEAPIAALLHEHADRWETIERLARVFTDPDATACLSYFISGNDCKDGYTVERLFDEKHTAMAFKALDASCWSKALEATDVLACMPAKRRDEWHEQIRKFAVPPFGEATLRATVGEHLAARHRYFAERVDGLFRALSPDHKTNMAAGFRSKMILQGITADHWHSTRRVDYLVDLRIVVARFMGRVIEREHDVHELTRRLVESTRRESRGEWVSVDGGAIEIRLYANGNCHVRVHDELAWRLNAVLASVNPGAIPESNQTRPAYSGKRAAKPKTAPTLVLRPLPFAVLKIIAEYSARARDLGPNEWQCEGSFRDLDKHVRAEVLQILASVGAVEIADPHRCGRVRFDYDPTDVLRELIASGCVPDQKAHQYYPTPRSIAERVVELADIGPDDLILEPSAGQGGIADLLPKDRTLCIEVSALHCAVLRAKGFGAIERDFLRVASGPHGVGRRTKVLMNPPFDRGQWLAHLEHAAAMLSRSSNSRLVAVLPASAAGKDILPGWAITWSESIPFAGTSIEVVILVAEPPTT